MLHRTGDGTPLAAGAHCPHLGAHLGRGGRVEGEDIVCPFHTFAFGPDGPCVRSGYGQRIPRMGLHTLDVRDVNGAVMVWWHAERRPATWDVSELRVAGFPRPIEHRRTLTAYPQGVNENAFDVGTSRPCTATGKHGWRRSSSTVPVPVALAPGHPAPLPPGGDPALRHPRPGARTRAHPCPGGHPPDPRPGRLVRLLHPHRPAHHGIPRLRQP
ncbi:Rieske 2Fe-2S domain-containing protein [Streptomyces mashuensis]|uniref:Rieske 2Fe-2S domain-containing protein n=1 Tax=Streptomyces mashuensis TaxID=33904 RepID=UPI00167C4734